MSKQILLASCLFAATMTIGWLEAFQVCANCKCITGSKTTATEANCPNIDPKVTQNWTICGQTVTLVAHGDCFFDDECPPVLNNTLIKTWMNPSTCKVEVEHQNRIVTAGICRDGGLSNLEVFCLDCCSGSTGGSEDDPNGCNPTHEQLDECTQNGQVYSLDLCRCVDGSPLLVSDHGNRTELTGLDDGVRFDLNGDGQPEWVSWTVPRSDAGFLVLDRNGNGIIDSGLELFGNLTPQPAIEGQNGFNALAVFDSQVHGGNGDGVISARDSAFQSLAVWYDENHDGESQSDELVPLTETKILALPLTYRTSRRTDRYGNEFRFWASVKTSGEAQFAVDVFLLIGPRLP